MFQRLNSLLNWKTHRLFFYVQRLSFVHREKSFLGWEDKVVHSSMIIHFEFGVLSLMEECFDSQWFSRVSQVTWLRLFVHLFPWTSQTCDFRFTNAFGNGPEEETSLKKRKASWLDFWIANDRSLCINIHLKLVPKCQREQQTFNSWNWKRVVVGNKGELVVRAFSWTSLIPAQGTVVVVLDSQFSSSLQWIRELSSTTQWKRQTPNRKDRPERSRCLLSGQAVKFQRVWHCGRCQMSPSPLRFAEPWQYLLIDHRGLPQWLRDSNESLTCFIFRSRPHLASLSCEIEGFRYLSRLLVLIRASMESFETAGTKRQIQTDTTCSAVDSKTVQITWQNPRITTLISQVHHCLSPGTQNFTLERLLNRFSIRATVTQESVPRFQTKRLTINFRNQVSNAFNCMKKDFQIVKTLPRQLLLHCAKSAEIAVRSHRDSGDDAVFGWDPISHKSLARLYVNKWCLCTIPYNWCPCLAFTYCDSTKDRRRLPHRKPDSTGSLPSRHWSRTGQ